MSEGMTDISYHMAKNEGRRYCWAYHVSILIQQPKRDNYYKPFHKGWRIPKHRQQRKLESWRRNTLSIRIFLLNMKLKHHDLTKSCKGWLTHPKTLSTKKTWISKMERLKVLKIWLFRFNMSHQGWRIRKNCQQRKLESWRWRSLRCWKFNYLSKRAIFQTFWRIIVVPNFCLLS